MFYPGGGGFPGGFPGYPQNRGTFEQSYHVYPVSFIDKPQLENGDKVIMPPSSLDRLALLQIDYPMLFEVTNPATDRTSHCGVLEFVADEGIIYMPYWMMQNLLLEEGDLVRLKSTSLPKGSFVKLQPHTKDFLDISNPKAVLETTLRNFSCLTVGDNIMVAYNSRKYYIDIIEAKPARAVTIIETDCEVDFAPPLDYVEPERVPPHPTPATAAATAAGGSSAAAAATPPEAVEEPGFQAFLGSGRRLDGKPAKPIAAASPVSPAAPPAATLNGAKGGPGSARSASGGTGSGTAAAGPSNAGGGGRTAGKLVFGSGSAGAAGRGPGAAPALQGASAANGIPKGASKEAAKEKEKEKEKEDKFAAFSGKKYSLQG